MHLPEYHINNMSFDYKGYGKIFVEKESDIEKVKEIIKEMDDFEYSYLPSNLIGVFEKVDIIELAYVGKFDKLNIQELLIKCWKLNIKCFAIY